MRKEIGPVLLSGLMIGPILGSGIVLLPPMAFGLLKGQSIWAWLFMMLLGGIFAAVFGQLAVAYPGEGGMTNAIDVVFGTRGKVFASYLMIGAVSVGPVAVALTATEYIRILPSLSHLSPTLLGIAFIFLAVFVLTKDLKFMSTMSFVLSTAIGSVLLIASLKTLQVNGLHLSPIDLSDVQVYGDTLQLLFWAIIGWEIVGNYSGQVRNIKKTIPLATLMSVVLITLIYLLVAMAMQSFTYQTDLSLVDLLYVAFGSSSKWMLAVLVFGLCFSTYTLIVGALVRLMHALASGQHLPKNFGVHSTQYGYKNGLIYFIGMHLCVLILNSIGLLPLEKIVNIANGFFLLNAIVGLLAGSRLIKNAFLKVGCWILVMSFAIILLFSTIEVYIAMALIAVITYRRTKQQQVHPKEANLSDV